MWRSERYRRGWVVVRDFPRDVSGWLGARRKGVFVITLAAILKWGILCFLHSLGSYSDALLRGASMAVRGQVACNTLLLFWGMFIICSPGDSRCSLDAPQRVILERAVACCGLAEIRCTSREVSHMQGFNVC